MHLQWKNYPTTWRGNFTSGFKGTHPTVILIAIADQQLWIWHAYFGVVKSNNDIDVLNLLPLFSEQCRGRPNHQLHCQRQPISYLVGSIYPKWPVFMKMMTFPTDSKRAFFAPSQEDLRKDVEQAFGVLLALWAIVKGPTCLFEIECVGDISSMHHHA